jgi:LuxR family maltose regulon positive regulatory protein
MPEHITHTDDGQFILERPRLDVLLKRSLDYSVVFVVAGEGCGKTHAVRSFLDRTNKKVIWISLSERDNDPRHFWGSVIKAVSFHDPGTGKALEEIGFPESQSQIIRCHAVLQDATVDRKKHVVVVDNCQLVREKSIHDITSQVLAFPFPKETIILISRIEPALNTMALLSKGFLFRINADDLYFNEDEITAYFRLRNITLSPEEAKKIFTDTEGWILAIDLVVREMEKENKKYCSSRFKNGSFRSKAEAIYTSVPVSFQRLLVILSLFDRWPLEVAEKIAGSPEKFPPQGERAEPFNLLSAVFYYDANLNGFRFHRLFLDFLREKQDELSREEIQSACAISAQWCMENNLCIDAAANHGIARNYKGLVKAIYFFPRLFSRPAAASILEIIEKVLKDSGRNEEDEDYLFLRHVTRAWLLLNLGRYDESRRDIQESIRVLEDMPPGPVSSRILSTCYHLLGSLSIVTYRITGDMDSTPDYFLRGSYYYMRCPYVAPRPMTKTSIGSYVNLIGHPPKPGEFEKFIDITARCVPHASFPMGGFLSGMDSLCRAEFAFFCGELDMAEKYAMEAVSKAREKEQYETESKSLFYLLRIHLCGGNVSAVTETWKRLEAQLDIPDYINRYVIHDIIAGWYFAHTRETERIALWLRRGTPPALAEAQAENPVVYSGGFRDESEEDDLNLQFSNFETMVKAKSLFAEKHYEEALNFLKRKELKKGLGSFHLGVLEINVLEAVVRSRMGDETGAIKALEAAYKMSLPNSLDMPFIEPGDDIRVLASAALNSEKCAIPRPWLETIRNKASVYSKILTTVAEQYRNKQGDGEVPFLTSQELSILAGISRGFTREKIAADSSLSINTVKNIIKTIYDKLGAFNSAGAIRIATSFGLLK